VSRPALTLAAAAVTAGSLVAGTAAGAAPRALSDAVVVLVVLVAGLAAALLLVRRCRLRLGGITGDVLGAGIEVALTTGLVTAALLVSLQSS
jgi:adenosylcobinamide-GDP ribazoletransferase